MPNEEKAMVLNVTYTVKSGCAKAFYDEANAAGIPQKSRAEAGCLRYEYYLPMEKENELLLIEVWKDHAAQKAHMETEHFKQLGGIKAKYVLETKMEEFIEADR